MIRVALVVALLGAGAAPDVGVRSRVVAGAGVLGAAGCGEPSGCGALLGAALECGAPGDGSVSTAASCRSVGGFSWKGLPGTPIGLL